MTEATSRGNLFKTLKLLVKRAEYVLFAAGMCFIESGKMTFNPFIVPFATEFIGLDANISGNWDYQPYLYILSLTVWQSDQKALTLTIIAASRFQSVLWVVLLTVVLTSRSICSSASRLSLVKSVCQGKSGPPLDFGPLLDCTWCSRFPGAFLDNHEAALSRLWCFVGHFECSTDFTYHIMLRWCCPIAPVCRGYFNHLHFRVYRRLRNAKCGRALGRCDA